MQVIGTFVHGVLAAFHGLGVVYNYRKGNKLDTLVHSLALSYDLNRVYKHYKEIKSIDDKVRDGVVNV